ncbi:hypothetical protein OEZ60_13180 [Defluviimonas sp. WL0024]|uniref:Uncharacterized protein n=2 Tax=Albidovulum TaxID=205889 RepID=A0ABT3JAB3_9RHOB|nr:MULTISPECIES: hypothetical protein [Defluviimonas]MCU9848957.1 hypothetical protein [Defluviimonas sp. WL0024]MCW3784632.1 hypothetical protein [Defluviimonas salinarum]
MEPATTHPKTQPETTDLERRVLAHERVLQALIAYMSRSEPRFVDHLRERFVEPMNMARHEHGYRGADDYAEEFIRAVMLLGEAREPRLLENEAKVGLTRSPQEQLRPEHSRKRSTQGDRVQLRERNGMWEVQVDGELRGDYYEKRHALAAAALLKLSLQ